MTGIIQTIAAIAMMFLLASSAGSHCSSIFAAGDRSEPVSEQHRECSPDENIGRLSHSVQPVVINQLRNKIRYAVVFIQKQRYLFVSLPQKPSAGKEYPDSTRIFLSTTVLRI